MLAAQATAIKYIGLLESPQPAVDGRNDVVRRDAGDADEADGQVRPRCPQRPRPGVDMMAVMDPTSPPAAPPAPPRAPGTALRRCRWCCPRRFSPAPTAWPMPTVIPIASPTSMTVTMLHDLAADGHRRRARHTVKLADDEQVCHAVKRLQK